MIPIAKPAIGEEEKKAVMEVLDSGMIAQGPKVKELEGRFAEFCGTKYAVAVNSGTSALHTALYALGIKPYDEVITTPFTFVATANTILMRRAKPVFVDIEEDTFNIDPELVKEKITSKTRAIIPVDLFGHVYEYKAIKEIAEDNKLLVLEDACQAINAEYDGKKVGSLGDMAAFSFYATKNIVSGEGGMITTDNKEYFNRAKVFRHHGQSEKRRYEYYDLGYNYRITDIQAALALVQMDKIDKLTQQRIENARLLSEGLMKIDGVKVPCVKENVKHVFHQYTIKVDGFKLNRDELAEYLTKNGIGNSIFYQKPLHLVKHFRMLGYKEGDFPVAEKTSMQVLSLPVHPLVTREDINRIIKVFEEI